MDRRCRGEVSHQECLALFNVDFGTALDLAFANAQDPHGRIVCVSVQPCCDAIILIIFVSGLTKNIIGNIDVHSNLVF